jgi:1-acyl-sn-glycerol-3-phosphate acyltransferase
MNTLGYLLRSVIAGISLFPWYFLGMIVGLLDQNRGLRIFINWNRFFLKLFHIEISLENENHATVTKNGCVFILLNQTSLLDGSIGAMIIPLPWRGLVNIEYALIPVFGWAMCLFSWVIIRQWPRQAQKTMQKVESFLQQGGNLWISIEGRRSEDGLLSPYKKGPVVLAINARAKIVPVIHSGVRNCLPYGKWRIRPGKVTIRYLKAIPTEDMQYDDRQEVVNTLRKLAEQKLFGDPNSI